MNENLKTLAAELKRDAETLQGYLNEMNDPALQGDDRNHILEKTTKLSTKKQSTRATYDAAEKASGLVSDTNTFLSQSGVGFVPFTSPNGVTMHGFTPSGAVTVHPDGTVEDPQYNGISDRALKVWGDQQYRKAYWNVMRKMANMHYAPHLDPEVKFLQEGTDTEGGFTVPQAFYDKIIMKKPTPTRLYPAVNRLQCSRDRLVIPKVPYTTDNLWATPMRVAWVGENPASATSSYVTDPTFGTVTIPIYTAMMSLPITRDLLEDSAFNLETWVADQFAETIELTRDNVILNGSGVNQPTGILSTPTYAYTSSEVNGQIAYVPVGNSANLPTADGMIQLAEIMPEQYEENCRYIFNKVSGGMNLRLLKDAQGRYLFARTGDNGPGSLVAGRPTECNGYPFSYSGFMPNVAANSLSYIFGDLSGYSMIDRVGFDIQIARELLIQYNQILVVGRIRLGGQVTEEWKFKIGKVSQS